MSNRTDAQMMFVTFHNPLSLFGAYSYFFKARRRTTFARQTLHRGIIHHYPPYPSSPFRSIRLLLPSTPEPHKMKGLSLSSPAVASHGGSSLIFPSLGKFQQQHLFSSCLKVTIVLMRLSWPQLWPRYFHWRCKSGGYQTAGNKGYSEPLMTRPYTASGDIYGIREWKERICSCDGKRSLTRCNLVCCLAGEVT